MPKKAFADFTVSDALDWCDANEATAKFKTLVVTKDVTQPAVIVKTAGKMPIAVTRPTFVDAVFAAAEEQRRAHNELQGVLPFPISKEAEAS